MRWIAALALAGVVVGVGCTSGDGARVSVTLVASLATSTPDTPAADVPHDEPAATLPPTSQDAAGTKLVAAGDVMLDRSVGRRILSDGPEVVFAGVRDVLAGADIAVVNLESPISNSGASVAKSYTFRAPPEAVGALADAGIDVAGLANNHARDYGQEALLDTIGMLQTAGIGAAGAGATADDAHSPVILERGGTTFAFLAYVDTAAEGAYRRETWEATEASPGVAWADVVTIRRDVEQARETADVVVVLLHAGVEYSSEPSGEQRSYAEAAIDAGAALVIGAHPHVLQPVEEYGGGLIAYSLGNFVFDGFDGSANTTAMLEVEFEGSRIASWRLIPAEVVDGMPVLTN